MPERLNECMESANFIMDLRRYRHAAYNAAFDMHWRTHETP
jgi:hypothetical protein